MSSRWRVRSKFAENEQDIANLDIADARELRRFNTVAETQAQAGDSQYRPGYSGERFGHPNT